MIENNSLPLHPSSIRDLLGTLTFLSKEGIDEVLDLIDGAQIRPFDESFEIITTIAKSDCKFDTVVIASIITIRSLNFKLEELDKGPAMVGYGGKDNRKIATYYGYR